MYYVEVTMLTSTEESNNGAVTNMPISFNEHYRRIYGLSGVVVNVQVNQNNSGANVNKMNALLIAHLKQ